MGTSIGTGKPERIYYIRDGKRVEEKGGRQFQDAMTPAKVSRIRAERIERDNNGDEPGAIRHT
jgi:hypothetical protein